MGKELRQAVDNWLTQNPDELTSLLSGMIRAASTQGNEAEVQNFLAEYLHTLGMEVDLWVPDGAELSADPLFASPRTDFTGSPNLAGRLRGTGGEGARSLLVNGHVDVVPVGDRDQWTHDPWGAEIEEGRMFGRGASDMKGGIASALVALKALAALDVRLRGDVIVECVVEEESGGAGTLAASRRGYRADGGLIPEPTQLKIFPKQQGSMWFRITVHGRGAHGGTRYQGISAIEKAEAVLGSIRDLERTRNERIDDPLYEGTPIPVPINVGVIRGGEWPSSVPDRVVLEGRMGVAPGESIEEVQQEMATALDALGEQDAWFREKPVELEWFGARWLPCDLDPDAEPVVTLARACESVRGSRPELLAAPWGTDAGLLQAATGTPTVVFGPGVTAMAHQPDEYILLEDVRTAALITALFMADWCGVE
ncbi:MAG: peptidase [Thermoleophilia bacterium]